MDSNSTSAAMPPSSLTLSSSSNSPTTPPPTTLPTPAVPPTSTSIPAITSTSTAPVSTEVVLTTVSPSSKSVVSVTSTSTSTTTPTTVNGQATPTASTSVSSTDLSTTDTQHPTNTSLADSGSSNGNGGLNGTAKVVVAVVVPIVGVALIAIALLFMWKRRQKTKADTEARRKEVEEYGYNPNNDPHGGAAAAGAGAGVARSSSNEETLYEMTESDATGYRGWGSTNGGRKVSNMGSSVGTSGPMSPVGLAFSDGGFPQQQGAAVNPGPDGYAGVATSPSTSTFPAGGSPSVDGNSNAPLIHGIRPGTADSSVIGAMNGPITADNSGGIHRGVSNASSNYSAMTQSDQSDVGQPLSHHDAQYYGVDDGYEDAYYSSRNPTHPYSGDNGYGPAPVIRDVSARRNTRIETPTNTHFPQQGNSGIAQNF